jgi:hypothetical protein
MANGLFEGYGQVVPYLFVSAIVLYAIAGIVATINYKKERANDASPPPPPPPPPVQNNQQFVEVKPEQHVYIGSDFIRQLRENAGPAEPPKLHSPPPKPEPNIKFLGMRSIKVSLVANVPLQLCSFDEQADAEIECVVACFRNEPIFGKTIKPSRGVRASLRLFHASGAEIGVGLSRAFWLGQVVDVVDLVPGGDTECVILLLRDRGNVSIPAKTRRTTGAYTNIGEGFEELAEPPHSIEVSLLGADDQLLLAPLSLELGPPGDVLVYRVKQS